MYNKVKSLKGVRFKMKKKIITLMITAAMVVSMMASCTVTVGKSDNDTSSADDTSSVSITTDDDTSSEDTSSEDTSSEEVSSSAPVNVEDIDIADKLDSYQIAIDGDVYTIPCDVAEFEKNGWKLGNSDATLKKNQYTLITQAMKKGDLLISVRIINLSDNEVKLADAQVGEVQVAVLDNVSTVLPGGFVFDQNTTVDDVKAKYGEPTDVIDDDDYVKLKYKGGSYKTVTFHFYKPESNMTKYNSVSVENFGM